MQNQLFSSMKDRKKCDERTASTDFSHMGHISIHKVVELLDRSFLISLFLFFSTILKTIDMEELLLLQQVAPHVIIKNAM